MLTHRPPRTYLAFASKEMVPLSEREDTHTPRPFLSRIPDGLACAIPFNLRSEIADTPERRLLVAALDDAIMTVFRHANATDPRGSRLREADLAWIRERVIGKVTFEQCCVALGCDPDAVERGIMRNLEELRQSGVQRKYKRSMHLVEGDRQ